MPIWGPIRVNVQSLKWRKMYRQWSLMDDEATGGTRGHAQRAGIRLVVQQQRRKTRSAQGCARGAALLLVTGAGVATRVGRRAIPGQSRRTGRLRDASTPCPLSLRQAYPGLLVAHHAGKNRRRRQRSACGQSVGVRASLQRPARRLLPGDGAPALRVANCGPPNRIERSLR